MLAVRFPREVLFCLAALMFTLLSGRPAANGQVHWTPRKETIEVRLIALAIAYPRSSFFANDEVFIAEQELARNESRFVKLVYDFLPYQSPLSSYGLNYSLVHKVSAVRDTTCDENLYEMRSWLKRQQPPTETRSNWKYALECPISDLDRRQARLRCYRTTSDDYAKAEHLPTSEIPY
jgi:hypothetical protein